jgi:hypothetical protein
MRLTSFPELRPTVQTPSPCTTTFSSLGSASATKPATSGHELAYPRMRGSGNVHGQSQSTQFHPARSRTPSKVGASRRSGCNVENRCTKQSENNETKRGLRVVKHLRSLSPLGPPTTPREQAFHVAVARASNEWDRAPLLMRAYAPATALDPQRART